MHIRGGLPIKSIKQLHAPFHQHHIPGRRQVSGCRQGEQRLGRPPCRSILPPSPQMLTALAKTVQ